jgi:hypothetical protein
MRMMMLRPFNFRLGSVALLLCTALAATLHADTITVGGIINQSTQDGTGPAVNNPSLNDIPDGAFYTTNLSFAESIQSPGTYDLTGSILFFNVGSVGAVENKFNSMTLTVALSGAFDQVGILACLTTGSACNQGNELDLDFMIPAVNLNDQNVVAQGILNLLPLDLLEDDGVTDIHGSITNYSYTAGSPAPEPSAFVLAVAGLLIMILNLIKRDSKNRP